MQIKIALPKGRLLAETSALLDSAGWKLDEYNGNGRLYHLKSEKFPHLRGKVFHEKDIPVQVAIGNYDLGICGLDWIEELLSKYPTTSIIKLKDMGYGYGSLFIAGLPSCQVRGRVRIASEYPNLAEAYSLKNRFGRFSVFPVWGAAEAYLPESADLALISQTRESRPIPGLEPVSRVLDFQACLIANRNAWETKDLFEVVSTIGERVPAIGPAPRLEFAREAGNITRNGVEKIRLALPDGHQQAPTFDLLKKAGIEIDDYPSPSGNRRPRIGLDGVAVKVVRPQDMPLQVANGNFDLAITGKDWLTEHLYQFPNSPVASLIDLKFGWVKIVAVVSQGVPAGDRAGLRAWVNDNAIPVRIASEYTNIADKYARDNHLGRYRIIPTWGATEAFLPEDADMLIENTQTGGTIARHNLKIIDTLFESTACLIANTDPGPAKRERIMSIAAALRAALEGV